MKRRNFLKNVFGVVAGLAVAPSVVKVKSPNNNVAEINKDCLYRKPPWTKLGCKDCYNGCRHFNDCLVILKLRVQAAEKAARPPFIINPNGDVVPVYLLGPTKETGSGFSYRKYRYCKYIDPSKEFFKVMAKELPPLLRKQTDDVIISSLI